MVDQDLNATREERVRALLEGSTLISSNIMGGRWKWSAWKGTRCRCGWAGHAWAVRSRQLLCKDGSQGPCTSFFQSWML